ncbi:MAG: hypothetical protein H7X71_07045, partial [Chitinophagales bacterium]|nr:hypothetical protein [Chitinophagales bacterium]
SIPHGNYGKINSILEILYRPPNVWPRIDTSSNYRLVINSENNDLLSLALYSDKSIVIERKIRIKKIKNDYVYLRNSNIKLLNIPFIFGGYDYLKTRFAVDKEGNLIVDSVDYGIGCALIIICSGTPTTQTTYLYEKEKLN